jgi:hypothetical protein
LLLLSYTTDKDGILVAIFAEERAEIAARGAGGKSKEGEDSFMGVFLMGLLF